MICKPSLHRRGHSQSFVYAAEIVERKMQSNSSFQIVELFRERIGEACKPSHLHSHGQILPLYIACAYVILVRLSLSNLGYNLDDWAWGVFCSVIVLAIISVQLDQLRERHLRAKEARNFGCVEPESVCCDLRTVIESQHQVANKIFGRGYVALPNGKRGNKFRLCIHRYKNPLVTKLCGIVFPNSALLLKAEGPYFIALDVVANQITHSGVKQPSATLSSQDEQLHDGVTVQSGHALCGTNGAAFNQALDSADSVLFRDTHGSQRANRLGIGEGCRAAHTAVTLDSVPPVAAKLLNGRVLTSGACHGAFPLEFLREKPENKFGSISWLTPRFGLAPQPAETGSGAHSQSIKSSWWFDNNFYGHADRNFHGRNFLSESPVGAGLSYCTPKSFLLGRLYVGQTFDCDHQLVVRQLPGSTGRPCQFVNPSIGDFVICASACLRNLATLKKPVNHRVDRSHYVAVFSDVITNRDEVVSNFCRDQRSTSDLLSEHGADCISQAHRVFFNELFIQHPRKSGYGLPQSSNAFFDFFLILEAFTKSLLLRKKVSLRKLQNFFVIRSSHNSGEYDMSKNKASNILDRHKYKSKTFWNQVVTDTEIRLARAKRKVEELEEALGIFKHNATDGAPIPGELSEKAGTAGESIST